MVSIEIKCMLSDYIKKLRNKYKKNKLPATVIGAEYKSYRKTDCSGAPPVNHSIAPKLLTSLNRLGTIGQKKNKNVIGCCCEVRASNKILLKRIKLNPKDIVFTKAIRPRTGQVIKRCENCEEVFGNE